MSESVVADFIGRFFAPEVGGEPPTGRIILSQRRLVLAADGYKETIPLSSVFDVKVGQVPPEMAGYFNDTVTLAYRRGEGRAVAAIEGKDKNIDKFATVLFKVLLNGTPVVVRHPARRGGRVTDAEATRATLDITHGVLAFEDCPEPFEVDLDAVTSVERDRRELGGGETDVISFRHMDGGVAVTSEVAIESSRLTNVLGRYIRLRYADIREELEDVDPSEEELEVLVAAYSAGPGVSLSNVVDIEPQRLTMLLNGLVDEGLLADGEAGTVLTAKGRVVVGQHIEDVNT